MPKPFVTVQGRIVTKAPDGMSSTGNRAKHGSEPGMFFWVLFLRQEKYLARRGETR